MTCSHHFILPPPNGAVSIGVCTLCGEKRNMYNSLDASYSSWKKTTKRQADEAKHAKEVGKVIK